MAPRAKSSRPPELFRAVVARRGLIQYLATGCQPSRHRTSAVMLRDAGEVVGQSFPNSPDGRVAAIAALSAWLIRHRVQVEEGSFAP